MSLGSFNSRFHWWWEGAHFARLEHANGAWIDIAFDPACVATKEQLVMLGVPAEEADRAREVSFTSPGHSEITADTGYGQAATVINTVARIIRAYMLYREPPVLSFLAEGTRAKVYMRLLKLTEIPLGYHVYWTGLPGGTYGADFHIVGPTVLGRIDPAKHGYTRLR